MLKGVLCPWKCISIRTFWSKHSNTHCTYAHPSVDPLNSTASLINIHMSSLASHLPVHHRWHPKLNFSRLICKYIKIIGDWTTVINRMNSQHKEPYLMQDPCLQCGVYIHEAAGILRTCYCNEPFTQGLIGRYDNVSTQFCQFKMRVNSCFPQSPPPITFYSTEEVGHNVAEQKAINESYMALSSATITEHPGKQMCLSKVS